MTMNVSDYLKTARNVINRDFYLNRHKDVVERFHILFYDAGQLGGTWADTFWLGVKTSKNPLDLWMYQEILYEVKPDVIVECGTYRGGSAFFFASVFDLLGHGQVVTIDVETYSNRPAHPRISYLLGSSTSSDTVGRVEDMLRGKSKVLVILDSDHHKEHVLQEMNIYSRFVSKGSYMVVEDTNTNGHPVYSDFGPGPMAAVGEFMKRNHGFIIDKSREKYLLTFYPNGWLKKIR
jgi:cephalosporin hydroxylase